MRDQGGVDHTLGRFQLVMLAVERRTWIINCTLISRNAVTCSSSHPGNVDVGATGKIKQVNVTISLLFCMTIWLEIWYMDVY